jgi:hypothetical protein
MFFVGGSLAPLACAAGNAQEDASAIVWSADTLVAEAELLRGATDSSRAGTLVRPFSVRAESGFVFITDIGDDRIAVLDSVANVVRTMGTRGRGPGELFGVSHIALRDGRLFAGEALNGRVSEFMFDGTFVRTYVSPYAAGAITAAPFGVYSAARSLTDHASALGDHAEPPAALSRSSKRTSAMQERWSILPGHDLLASDSSTTWVFDQGIGSLCAFRRARGNPRCSLLPEDLDARLHRYRRERVGALEAATRLRVEAAPLAKDMVRVGSLLALLLPLPELPIVLIDPADGEVTPVMLNDKPAPAWVRAARSFSWDGRGFLLVGDEGIGRLYISRSIRE